MMEIQTDGVFMDFSWIDQRLEQIHARNLYRALKICPEVGGAYEENGVRKLSFSSNDYLNLSRNSEVVAAACEAAERFGVGAASSRLIDGTLPPHAGVEEALASLTSQPRALVFGAGYLANLAVLSTLGDSLSRFFVDRLAHASIYDGLKLARAPFVRFRHNDLEHLELLLSEFRAKEPRARAAIVTESVFSMDGDRAPLHELVQLSERFGAHLILDEAHAVGMFGPNGGGLAAESGLSERVSLITGTLSKALGSYGGFVAGNARIIELLINSARPFIYNTALPPAMAAAAIAAISILQRNQSVGASVRRCAAEFSDLLRGQGIPIALAESQIVPLIVGENQATLHLASKLCECGISVRAFRPPTVPPKTARIRFSFTAAHSDDDVNRAAEVVVRCFRELTIA